MISNRANVITKKWVKFRAQQQALRVTGRMTKMRPQIAVFALALSLDPSPASCAVYDRAITLFSPKGDLMQVSYAEQAVQRGSLAVAATNGRDVMVLCLEHPQQGEEANADPSEEETAVTDDDDEDTTGKSAGEDKQRRRRRENPGDYDNVRRGMFRTGRTTGVLDDANNQNRKLCEVDEDVYLAFAGISADGRVLASKVRVECQNYRYNMGVAPSIGYIARFVGGLQHKYTRTGGARPYGLSCLLAGFDDDGTPRLFRSEPSGAFAEWAGSAVGKASEKALGKLEEMPDMGQLDWRKIVEVAVRAALVGNAKSCDVLVLRRTSREMSRENEPSGVKQPVETGTSGLHERRDDSVGQGVVLVEKFVGGTGPKGAGVWLKTVEGVLERL